MYVPPTLCVHARLWLMSAWRLVYRWEIQLSLIKPWWRSCRPIHCILESSLLLHLRLHLLLQVVAFVISAVVQRCVDTTLLLHILLPILTPRHCGKEFCEPSIDVFLSHGLWGAMWAVDTDWDSFRRWWGFKRGTEAKGTPHLSLCISSAAGRLQGIMQHLKPWRALLLLTVLCQPGISDKYGKMTVVTELMMARSLSWIHGRIPVSSPKVHDVSK